MIPTMRSPAISSPRRRARVSTVFTSSAAFTLANNVDNVTYTGAGGFTGTGNGQANVITGGAGSDVLSGASGNDQLLVALAVVAPVTTP